MVTFDVTLNSQPFADVTVFIVSGNVAEGTVSVSSLTFTAANWSVAQQVSVIGENEFIDDGDQAYVIELQPAVSADRNYDALDVGDVALTNQDDDTAGITLTPTAGLTTDESGTSDSFSVVLTSQPLADVVIGLSSSNSGEGTLSTSSLTFTPGNWNIPQLVTVTGVNDLPSDGDIAYQAIASPASSSDPGYAGMLAGAVDITNLDVMDPVTGDPPVAEDNPPPPGPENDAGAPEMPPPWTPPPVGDGEDNQPTGESIDPDELVKAGSIDAGLNDYPGTLASSPASTEPVQRKILINPESEGGMLLRLLEIIHVEHTQSGMGTHSLAPAIKVEISRDEDFKVMILSQGAQLTAVTLSVGAVWWALRAGGLFTSLLTSLPAWRSFDVLPVLNDDEDEDDSVWEFGEPHEDDGQQNGKRPEELTQ